MQALHNANIKLGFIDFHHLCVDGKEREKALSTCDGTSTSILGTWYKVQLLVLAREREKERDRERRPNRVQADRRPDNT